MPLAHTNPPADARGDHADRVIDETAVQNTTRTAQTAPMIATTTATIVAATMTT
jgi:hypothetical protein